MCFMKKIARWNTEIGIFYIGFAPGQYHVIFNGYSLGAYDDPQCAVDYLVYGYIDTVRHPVTKEPISTSTLGFPEDFSDWIWVNS